MPTKHPFFKGLNHHHRLRITAFEDAVRTHEMMGAMPPEDHELIQNNYDHSKKILIDTIVGLYGEKSKQ